MIRRSSKTYIDNLLNQNPNWNILDIGCGYTAHKNASVICDVQDLSNIYKEKHFVKLTSNILPNGATLEFLSGQTRPNSH